MNEHKRGGLGRGLAALIPSGPAAGPRLGSAAADVIIGARREHTVDEPTTVGGSTHSSAENSTTETPIPRASDRAASSDAPPVQHDDGSTVNGTQGPVYRELDPASIVPNPRQPRMSFDEDALAELVHSIREFGLMQPVVVRETVPGSYELVMGERRWRASQQVGMATIPAIVRRTADEAMLRDALLENIHRAQLNPLEEAAAYSQLLEEFDVTHDELAARLGRSRPVISNTIRLLRLPVPVQRRVAAGVLSAGHARALLSLEDPRAQEELAVRVVAEGMSVRATEEAVLLHRHDGATPAGRAPVPARGRTHVPALDRVAERLSRTLDTRVTVTQGQRKGKIVVEFGSSDDLDRILRVLGEHDPSHG